MDATLFQWKKIFISSWRNYRRINRPFYFGLLNKEAVTGEEVYHLTPHHEDIGFQSNRS
jgi:hypothetical protein